jgi:N,N'-diacetyllegionaminate synthase
MKAGNNRDNISILHCTTDYPTAMQDVNLNSMITIKNHFQLPIGYSDHTLGIEVPIAAVAMGATIIEKHFTLNKTMPGPDHKASLEPDELVAMTIAIRNIEKALGRSEKIPTEAEVKNRAVARKSIHVTKDLKSGHVLVESDLIMKRPGDGISPMQIIKVLGKKVKTDLTSDSKLSFSDIE